jgi:hypothetical protein
MPRKHFTTSIDVDLLKELKKLAIDLDRNANDLLEEGIKYILKKYEKKTKKYTGKKSQVLTSPVFM